jgi:hypothetical protein
MTDTSHFYPDYNDPSFNEKIYKKKEFYINKTQKYSSDLNLSDGEGDFKCNSGFKLSDNQKFLKTFMGPDTPYNSLLLFHGTGVGKTCSSISIAEQYSNELEKYNKKVIILLNPSIEDNFKKNIFNVDKIKSKKTQEQCLRDTYYKKISKKSSTDIKGQINKLISQKYMFIGYQAFANRIERIKKLAARAGTKNVQGLINDTIRKNYSNSVMIIDEAHNIKEGSSGSKILPPLLELVIRNTDNLKLLLLTATPMFNEPQEIIYLLNLMLLNNKQDLIITEDVFHRNGELTRDGKDIIINKSRGIVSYLRGENPLAFPKRLYPKDSMLIPPSKFPLIDYTNPGVRLQDNERIKNLKLIPCVLKEGGHQQAIYNHIEEEGFGAFDSLGVTASNIAFPSDRGDTVDAVNYKSFISNDGFFSAFDKNKFNKKLKLTPKHDKSLELLDKKTMDQYSTKLKKIMDNIENNKEGIIFIYSRFVWTGIVPLALALEYNGYNNANGNLLNVNDKVGKNKGNYIIISGDKDLSPSHVYSNYSEHESSNKDGSKVKIILGSESAAEGLDFKYIREVHIMDPWHHLNKLEQVIGRGIRYCSHIELPMKQRNVTIFMYATVKEDTRKETVDLKIYRDAENKDRYMAGVEYLLKINAVDCHLNIHNNKFINAPFNKKFLMEDSWGANINVLFEENENGSKRCNYEECDFKCAPNELPDILTERDIDSKTFDIDHIKDNVYEVIEVVREIFKEDSVFNIDHFQSHELIRDKINNELLYLTLDTMINEAVSIRDQFNNKGKLSYSGGYYFFAPEYLKTKKISLREIKSPPTLKNRDSVPLKNVKFTKLSKVKVLDINYTEKNLREFLYSSYTVKKSIIEDFIHTENKTNGDVSKCFIEYEDIGQIGNKKIFGYFIANKGNLEIMKYENQEFKTPSTIEDKMVKQMFKRKLKAFKPKEIIGYLEEKGNTVVFKVRDKRGEDPELENKKKKNVGGVCTDKVKDTLIDLLEDVTGDSIDSQTKPKLCKLLKEALIKKTSFFSVEEALFYKLGSRDY